MNSAELELDGRVVDDKHDYMIDWVNEEAKRLGRKLTWDEARALLLSHLDLRTDGDEILTDWLNCTSVPLQGWTARWDSGETWGCFEDAQWAEWAAAAYLPRIKHTSFTVEPIPEGLETP